MKVSVGLIPFDRHSIVFGLFQYNLEDIADINQNQLCLQFDEVAPVKQRMNRKEKFFLLNRQSYGPYMLLYTNIQIRLP